MPKIAYQIAESTKKKVNDIICGCCKCLSVDRCELNSKSRKRDLVDARIIIVGKIKSIFQNKEVTYKFISEQLNRKLVFSFESEIKYKELLKTDKKFKEKYEMVVNYLDKNTTAS